MVVKIFDWRTSTLLDFSWCVARIRRVAQNVNYPQLSQGASTLIIGLRLSVGVVLGWLTHSPYPTQRSSRRLALGQHRPRVCASARRSPSQGFGDSTLAVASDREATSLRLHRSGNGRNTLKKLSQFIPALSDGVFLRGEDKVANHITKRRHRCGGAS
ncbi:MAG: hypothetical protein AOA65_1682 [Candidatus Bathyarchaeota archaeon BA1]|nr:MAG: hypothetical protein AOA65_1682 [Candidatus Bathyarchaeota archaeon BA1]